MHRIVLHHEDDGAGPGARDNWPDDSCRQGRRDWSASLNGIARHIRGDSIGIVLNRKSWLVRKLRLWVPEDWQAVDLP